MSAALFVGCSHGPAGGGVGQEGISGVGGTGGLSPLLWAWASAGRQQHIPGPPSEQGTPARGIQSWRPVGLWPLSCIGVGQWGSSRAICRRGGQMFPAPLRLPQNRSRSWRVAEQRKAPGAPTRWMAWPTVPPAAGPFCGEGVAGRCARPARGGHSKCWCGVSSQLCLSSGANEMGGALLCPPTAVPGSRS